MRRAVLAPLGRWLVDPRSGSQRAASRVDGPAGGRELACEKGYAGGGPQVRAPNTEGATGLLKGVAAVDRAATAVGRRSHRSEHPPEMAQGAVRAFQGLPRGVQLGAGAAAGGLVLYGVHRLTEGTRRKRRPR